MVGPSTTIQRARDQPVGRPHRAAPTSTPAGGGGPCSGRRTTSWPTRCVGRREAAAVETAPAGRRRAPVPVAPPHGVDPGRRPAVRGAVGTGLDALPQRVGFHPSRRTPSRRLQVFYRAGRLAPTGVCASGRRSSSKRARVARVCDAPVPPIAAPRTRPRRRGCHTPDSGPRRGGRNRPTGVGRAGAAIRRLGSGRLHRRVG